MLLKDKWVNDEIKEEIRKYLKTDDNKNTTLQQSMEKDPKKNRYMYMCERTTSCTPRTNKTL